MAVKDLFSVRYSAVYAICAILFSEYFKRFVISMVIVAMTTDEPNVNGTKEANITDDVYAWDRNTRGYITSSYFYAYSVSTFMWGFVISRYGVRNAVIVCHIVGCIIQLVFPWAADVGPALLCVLRGIDGFFSGLIYVAACELIGNWSTPKERLKFSALISSSGWMAIIFCFLGSGVIAEALSWRYVCYVTSGLIFLSLLFWLRFGYDNPTVHPRISKSESEHILSSVDTGGLVKRKAPWRKILSSTAVVAIAVYNTYINWNIYGVISNFPQYLKDVHDFQLVNNGLLNALPFILALVSSALFGRFSNGIQKKLLLTNTRFRKYSVAISAFPSAVCFLLIAIGGKNLILCIFCVAINGFSLGIGNAALYANFAELSPRYSGEISSISNGFANIPGYIGPLFTGLITQQNTTQHEWMFVFLILSAVSFCGASVFCCLGSGEVQDWDQQFQRESKSSKASSNVETEKLCENENVEI